MTSCERFVLDTNVVVSALLSPRSVPRQAFNLAFRQGIVLVSEATFDELDEVLRRSRFERYVAEAERRQFIANFIQDATVVEVTMMITECRDAKDNKFLELAVSGGATRIITGDADLLALHPFRGIAIVTPQQFLVSIGGE